MKVYLVRSNLGINGEGDYNPDTNRLTVFAGSVVSENISSSKKFRGAISIERLRSKYVADRIVKEMVSFNSPSTAAIILGSGGVVLPINNHSDPIFGGTIVAGNAKIGTILKNELSI